MADATGTIALYTEAERAHWGPIPEYARPRLLELVRAGANRRCVDCDQTPLDGGLRCYGCFQARCAAKVRKAPTGCGTDKGFQKHRYAGEEPCGPCRDAHRARDAEQKRRRRQAAA